MRAVSVVLAFGLGSGCVTVQERSTEVVSAEGVTIVQGRSDSGDLTYDGSAIRDEFTIGIRSYGNGGGKRKATQREEDNDFAIGVEAQVLSLAALSGPRSGVDFDVVGPPLMHTDLVTQSGHARLQNVDGVHVVTASSVFARNVIGDADLYANYGDIDAEILPYVDGVVAVQAASGSVDLYIPWGLDYDLNVVGDPEYELVIEDLGFDTLVLEPGLAIGWRGSRSIQVDVFVTGGDARVFAAL